MSNLRLEGVKTNTKTKRRSNNHSLLRPRQAAALTMISGGSSMKETCTAIKVSPRTLYRWVHEDARFRAAYNQWQKEMQISARSVLTAGARQAAITIVRGAIAGNVRAATTLLKGMGLLTPKEPGPVHPANALCEMKIEEKRETNAIGHQIAIEYFDPEELDGVPEGRPKPAPGVGEDDPDAGPNDIVFNGRQLTPEEMQDEGDEEEPPRRQDSEHGGGEDE